MKIILISWLFQSKGFPSVHHYLQDLRHKWDQEMQQENEMEEEATSETDHEIEEEDKIEQVAEKTDWKRLINHSLTEKEIPQLMTNFDIFFNSF